MLGIKSENMPIEGTQAIEVLAGMERRSRGNFTPQELSQMRKEEEIRKKFNVEWLD